MKNPAIYKFISPGIPLLVFLTVLYAGSWILDFFYNTSNAPKYAVESFRIFEPDSLWNILSIFLITQLNILMIILINNKFSIIRIRSFLPVFFYALFILTWGKSHFSVETHLVLTVFLISLMLFLGMYKNKKSVEAAFWGSLFLSLTGLLNSVYLFLIPIAWFGFAHLKSLSVKVFLASLMGIMLPWIYYFTYMLYSGHEIPVLIGELRFGLLGTDFSLYERIYVITLVLIFTVCLFGIYADLLHDSVQTRKNINFFILSLIFLFILIVILPDYMPIFLPIIAFFISILFAHAFTLNNSLFFSILFFFLCLLNLAYMAFNYITV